ncbi:MAG: class I SAM-dependent methyltransferase [Reichenbachiella sp.]|uniref:O-methyltransferase n=1 Tax=Reichenbachiella sp. TaxID=2184521 RepID=UPI003267E355
MNFNIIIFRIFRYLRYWLLAVDEHSLQSPFVYEVYSKALCPSKRKEIADPSIEEIRKKLQRERRSIEANTLGSGSSMTASNAKKMSKIARSGISNRRQSEILVNLVETMKYKTVLELGTSLGLNAIYLSQSKGVQKVVTVEGNDKLAAEANKYIIELKAPHVKLVKSDIDKYLEDNKEKFDLIYIDANHTYEATLRYFALSSKILSHQGTIVIDDINWSKEMCKAWMNIVANSTDQLTIENHNIGIVFANRTTPNKHYVLRF